MLRNPAHQGTAYFQKTRQAERQRVNRRLRQRGGIPARPVCSRPRPREEWIAISVPALVSPVQFAVTYAAWINRSQIESAIVGSPMSSCLTGTWLVISMEARSVRSSSTSSKSSRPVLVSAARPQSSICVELHITRLVPTGLTP